MHRRFEFVSGSSAKFWEVVVADSQVTVRFGQIGTAGQSQCRDLPNHQQAQQHAEKLVSQKLAKGYVECAIH